MCACVCVCVYIPAERPMVPAFLRPFFFMIKLDPMKMQELKARARPFTLSGVKD